MLWLLEVDFAVVSVDHLGLPDLDPVNAVWAKAHTGERLSPALLGDSVHRLATIDFHL